MNGRTAKLIRRAATHGPVLAPLKMRKRALKKRWKALSRGERSALRIQLQARLGA